MLHFQFPTNQGQHTNDFTTFWKYVCRFRHSELNKEIMTEISFFHISYTRKRRIVELPKKQDCAILLYRTVNRSTQYKRIQYNKWEVIPGTIYSIVLGFNFAEQIAVFRSNLVRDNDLKYFSNYRLLQTFLCSIKKLFAKNIEWPSKNWQSSFLRHG